MWPNWIGLKRTAAACVCVVAATFSGTITESRVRSVEVRPSHGSSVTRKPIVDARAYVQARVSRIGWTAHEWRALAEIIHRESRWNVRAQNPHSSAYGLFQILHMKPGTPLRKQVEQGIKYIRHRYGLPSVALKHWDEKGWY